MGSHDVKTFCINNCCLFLRTFNWSICHLRQLSKVIILSAHFKPATLPIRNLENPRNPILSQKIHTETGRDRLQAECSLLQEGAPTDLHSLHAEVLMTLDKSRVRLYVEDMLVVSCLFRFCLQACYPQKITPYLMLLHFEGHFSQEPEQVSL